jgi:hypothetical protein
MWLTQTNVTRWANLADLSNEGNDFTFVYDNNRIIYNALGHYSGSPFHQEFDSRRQPLRLRMGFSRRRQVFGATDFNKIHQPGNSPGDDPSLQREQTTWSFMRALGVPWGYRRFVAVYANGNRRGALMEDAQVPDSDMVKQYFPNDTGGFLYKMQPWFEFAPFPSGYTIGLHARKPTVTLTALHHHRRRQETGPLSLQLRDPPHARQLQRFHQCVFAGGRGQFLRQPELRGEHGKHGGHGRMDARLCGQPRGGQLGLLRHADQPEHVRLHRRQRHQIHAHAVGP